MQYGKFSSSSDVWSFGVTMWEILTRGKEPWHSLSNQEATAKIQDGFQLEKPREVDDDIWSIVIQCWIMVGLDEIKLKFSRKHPRDLHLLN